MRYGIFNALNDKSVRGRIYALLRMFSLTIEGLAQNNILSRAAALSFSSLIGIGPLLAIGVMISGFILESSDSDLTVNNLNRFIKFVAPPFLLNTQGWKKNRQMKPVKR